MYVVINGNERTTFIINSAIRREPTAALNIGIASPSDVQAIRLRLATFIWGEAGVLYDLLPGSVEQGVQDAQFENMEGLASIDRITVSMDYGLESIVYLFHPSNPNGSAIVYHQGHAAEGFIKGFHIIESFIRDGYTVAALSMPLRGMNNRPQNVPTKYGLVNLNTHNDFAFLEGEGPSAIRFFLTPVIAVLNYLDANYTFSRYDMVGISGGGWTTVIAAALDPRITKSFQVTATLPIPLRNKLGDFENELPELYELASYTELYVMAASGPGREHVQIMNQFEREGLAPFAPLLYQPAVNDALASIGQDGKFDVVLDATTQEHEISHFALSLIRDNLQQTF